MEERLIDKDELRGVKRKRTDGEEDAVDALSSDAAAPEEEGEEYALEFGGEEYDEDLVGLTPTQLKEELERREQLRAQAHAESEKHAAEGERLFAAGDYPAAAEAFRAALTYEMSAQTEERVFASVTENYTSAAPLLERASAEEFSVAEQEVREKVLGIFGGELRAERARAEGEAAPLRERVHAAQAERRAPFAANRSYYLVRFLVSLGALLLFAVGIAVSAGYLLRTRSDLPTVLVIVFGVLAFASFCLLVVFSRKLLVAVRLCRENERLSSTEEGARLAVLEEKLACLALVLDGAAAREVQEAQDGEEEN